MRKNKATRVLTSVMDIKNCPKSKRAQVWIETVIYILIAFTLIGAVLAFVKPKIEEMQDKAIIEQSIGVLEDVNNIILDVKKVSGNQRVLDLAIKKGTLNIDANNDSIYFDIESRYLYSQVGQEITKGSVKVLTEEGDKYHNVRLKLDYSGKYDLTLKSGQNSEQITKAASMYKITISYKGDTNSDGKIELEFDVG